LSNNGTEVDFNHNGGIIAAIFIALLSFLFTCCVNALATLGPNSNEHLTFFVSPNFSFVFRIEFFDKSTAQVSDENPTEFTPAGPTFSLWGLIYTWQVKEKRSLIDVRRKFSLRFVQLAFLIYSIVNIWRKTDDGYFYIHPYTLHVAIFILFIANILLNSFWLFLWDRLKFGVSRSIDKFSSSNSLQFSTFVIFLMLATIIGAGVFDHILLWHTRADFIRLNMSVEIFDRRP
jgi:hypothetical protein